ncbi:hypothetical protein VCSRO111_0603 [Vibrio cholerae]|nr:hypothetical protein [Vibrio cholerae]GHX89535.1 hypothetical protein VCSRO111_0603 [Vibrio cholerae]
MKFEITSQTIEEIAMCIVDCGMDRDEAADYAKNTLLEVNGLDEGGEDE